MVVVLCGSMGDAQIVYNSFLDWIDDVDPPHPILLRKDMCVEDMVTKERYLFTDYRISDVLDPEGVSTYYHFVDQDDFIELLWINKMAYMQGLLTRDQLMDEEFFYSDSDPYFDVAGGLPMYGRVGDAFEYPREYA